MKKTEVFLSDELIIKPNLNTDKIIQL